MKKVVVDIGGTKTHVSIMENGEIRSIRKFDTPRKRKELLRILSGTFEYRHTIKTLNLAIAGRFQDERVILAPNIPLMNFKLRAFFSGFDKVNIENDTLCAAHNLLKDGVKNALLVNWGTGIGGAIIIDGRIYRGKGKAGEIGHVRLLDGDWEDILGGKSFMHRYGMDGKTMQYRASMGDKIALDALKELGSFFGEFLVSMVYIVDPEQIFIYGGVVNSWRFMKKSVYAKLSSFRMKNKIKVVRDRYYTLRGCYYLDEF